MVATQYANYNKYFRQLQTHPDIQYLLSHFVTPSSVVFIWNRLSLILKGYRFSDMEWNDVFGCDMTDRVTCIRYEDLNHLTVIQQETGNDLYPGGELKRCFSFRNKPVNECYVISTNEASLRGVYGTRNEDESDEFIPVFSHSAKLPLAKGIGHHPSQSLLSHCSSPIMTRPSFGRKEDMCYLTGLHIPTPLGVRATPLAPYTEGREESISVLGESLSIQRSQEYDRWNNEGGSVLERKGHRHTLYSVSME